MSKLILFVASVLTIGCSKSLKTPEKDEINRLKEKIEHLELKLDQSSVRESYLKSELDGVSAILYKNLENTDTKPLLNTTYLMETSMHHVSLYLQSKDPQPNGYDGGYDDCLSLSTIIEYEDFETKQKMRARVITDEHPPEVINACALILNGAEY